MKSHSQALPASIQSGNEAAQWEKLRIVALMAGPPCLQFQSGILQPIKTRDKGMPRNCSCGIGRG